MASKQDFTEDPAASSANQSPAFRVKMEPNDEKITPGQEHSHSFYYEINKERHMVTCTKRCTVLEALRADPPFETFLERNNEKSIIIERDNSFIATHFPCWLLKEEETVLILWFSGDTAEVSEDYEIKDGNIVTFSISSTGGSNMKQKRFLRNSNLKHNKSLCIYAYCGETVEDALKRDGRFTEEAFQESIALCEEGENQTNIQLTTKITQRFDKLKTLRLKKTVLKRRAEDKSADAKKKPKSARKSDPNSNTGNPSAGSAPGGSKPRSGRAVADEEPDFRKKVHELSDSAEILQILREQFQGLVEHMKERHKKTEVEDVVQLLREEFGKNIQGFSEISTVKKLMEMSASVCYLEVENHNAGTGFLLFDRYILTNAHIINDIVVSKDVGRKVSATFAFESLAGADRNSIWHIKSEIVTGKYHVDEFNRWMDFALLELDLQEKDEKKLPPALLNEYAPFPGTGGICLIGHPYGGVKKMDTSSIIAKEERAKAVDIDFSEEGSYIQYINFLHGKELTYHTCFFHGSSGSPIFGESCQLVGMHTGGYIPKINGEKKHVIEYGISMRSILENLFLQMRREKKCEPLSKLITETMKRESTIQVVAGFIKYMVDNWEDDLKDVSFTVITAAKECPEFPKLYTFLCNIIPTNQLQALMSNHSSSKKPYGVSEFLEKEDIPMETDGN